MIKELSYSEAEKFHKELVKKMIYDLRQSDSHNRTVDVEQIEWAYSYEPVNDPVDLRKNSTAIDRRIRKEKLLRLDANLNKVEKSSGFMSLFSKPVKETEVISEKISNLFSKIVALSLRIKVGEYERLEVVDKTTLFESKVKEEEGNFKF